MRELTISETIEAIKTEIPIREVLEPGRVSGYVCPHCGSGTHEHGTGAVKVYDGTNTGGCYACPEPGQKSRKVSVVDCLMYKYNVDFMRAVEIGAEMLGITIKGHKDGRTYPTIPAKNAEPKAQEPETPQEPPKASQSDEPQKGGEVSAESPQEDKKGAEGARDTAIDYNQYYMECQENIAAPAAESYLSDRGISIDTAIEYGIGYDPAWISPKIRRDQRAKGSNWLPEPTKRIIVPVTDNHYFARALSPVIVTNKKTGERKDLTKQHETGGGKMGFFNMSALYDDSIESVFIVEGEFDALSTIEVGAAAVALSSAVRAGALAKALEHHPTRATLILCRDNDPDEETRKTVNGHFDKLREELTRLNISHIDADICCGYKDANEALVKDREAFAKAVRNAQTKTAARPDIVRGYIDNLLYGDIDALKAAGEIKTGFTELDNKSGGINPGLYVLAAISSLGKTTLALQIADNLAAAGHDVLFFSLEMSRLELVTKSFARLLTQTDPNNKITSLALRKGYYGNELKQAAEIYKAKGIADHLSIIEGNFDCNISFISEYVRSYKRKTGKAPIVFVDYLQTLQPASDPARARGTTKDIIDNNVIELKRISRGDGGAGVPVFVISSVNRANYLTPIDFESLKESGGIEYTADVVYGLQLQCLSKNAVFEKEKNIKEKREVIKEAKAQTPRKIELVCLKNRYGISSFSCDFDYYPDRDLFVGADSDGFYNQYAARKKSPKKSRTYPTIAAGADSGEPQFN